jgi:NAD(P)H-nitrite reductase large subunit
MAKKKATGLGDTIEQVLEVTKIAKVAKWILGEDCGCEERKEKLNKLFKYAKPKCLTEDEHTYLSESEVLNKNIITPSEQRELLKIYNRVFNKRMQPTSCGSCVREVVDGLKQVVNEYKEENESTES